MDGVVVDRRQLITGAGVAGAGIVGALAVLRPQAALAADDSGKSIVGGWTAVVDDLDQGQTIHVAIAFAPGGGVMETDDGGGGQPGVGVGAWVATGEHRFRLEFFSFGADPQSGGVVTITIRGPLEYHPDTDTITGTSRIKVVDANGNVLFESVKGQTVTGTRIHP